MGVGWNWAAPGAYHHRSASWSWAVFGSGEAGSVFSPFAAGRAFAVLRRPRPDCELRLEEGLSGSGGPMDRAETIGWAYRDRWERELSHLVPRINDAWIVDRLEMDCRERRSVRLNHLEGKHPVCRGAPTGINGHAGICLCWNAGTRQIAVAQPVDPVGCDQRAVTCMISIRWTSRVVGCSGSSNR